MNPRSGHHAKAEPPRNCTGSKAARARCGASRPGTGRDACPNPADGGNGTAAGPARVRRPVLKLLEALGTEVTVHAIRKTLRTSPDVLHYIHHKKMEELVASVISEVYFDTPVTVCGRSRDGGIDMVLDPAETPIAVQVKRRTKPGSVEGVAPVREFLGACLLRGFTQCLYVTSAMQFSRMARREAERAVAMQLVERFDLIERDRLLALLDAGDRGVLHGGKFPRWENLVPLPRAGR